MASQKRSKTMRRSIYGWGLASAMLGAGLLASPALAQQTDQLVLSSQQRLSCSRGLSAGKLSTATCRSYAYLFNLKTSDYFRCAVTMAVTRDIKEVISVQTDSKCSKQPRIFETDAEVSYSFDAAETDPPNTNSFFGLGGHVIWAADRSQQRVRSCMTIPAGNEEVVRCMDMTFN